MTTKTSYINLLDLDEVMILFFSGGLDNVDKYLSNLYKDVWELDPDNSLIGQLCSDDVKQCMYKLTELERAAIEFHYLGESPNGLQTSWAENFIKRHYVTHQLGKDFYAWAESFFWEAFDRLAIEILEIL